MQRQNPNPSQQDWRHYPVSSWRSLINGASSVSGSAAAAASSTVKMSFIDNKITQAQADTLIAAYEEAKKRAKIRKTSPKTQKVLDALRKESEKEKYR
jgi:hypothetical protein